MWLPLGASATADWQDWVQWVYQFGPFAFAILFLMVLTWSMADRLDKAEQRNAPDDARMWRLLTYSTFGTGIVLAGVCIVWWWGHQQATYVFQGRINDLASYEQLSGRDVYFRNEWKTLFGTVSDLRRDVDFMVIQTKPFTTGQHFALEYAKGTTSPRSTLDLVFDPTDADPVFEIVWDEKSQTNTLRRKTYPPAPTHAWWLLNGVVMAQSSPAAVPRHAAPLTTAEVKAVVEVLQGDRSDVGSRIEAIDRVLASGSAREVLGAPGNGTPTILTFYTLSHHSDPELAYKARRVLETGGAADMLAEDLATGSPLRRAEARTTLAGLPRADAEAILARTRARNPGAAKTLTLAAQPTAVPVPTGSPQGDRYYVRATWDPKQQATVSCLTELFNRELASHRTIGDEAALMRGRSSRVVFWYTKEWAAGIANSIRTCGATAEFVQP
ncbi:MAG TPA: hypothetical protein VMX54_00350 [Vicinamibacteria bacterium]|nr:hypothetical protein [Vicinamibacteria bacterium]